LWSTCCCKTAIKSCLKLSAGVIVVQIMLDVATKDSMKSAKDRIRIKEQKEEVERQKVVAASSGVKRGHAKPKVQRRLHQSQLPKE